MRILSESYVIVRTTVRDGPAYIVAPPGYTRRDADGTLYRDGSLDGGPEWGKREHAHHFPSHRAAARVANLCAGATVEPMHLALA